MKIYILLFFAAICTPSLMGQKGNSKLPVPVIFDTDIGPDYDDIGAIAILHAMADRGECKILATIASNKHRYIAAVLDVMNTYFHRPAIPIGVVSGNAVNIEALQKWDSLIVSNYRHDTRNNEEADDALRLYRKILSGQPDQSVTIITVGFLTNMANLLQSGPDEFSSLTGKELISKKVKQLVCMAAIFDNRMGTFKEFNVVKDSIASKITFDNWPTPILFSGFEIGSKIFTGLPIIKSKINHSPVKDVFARSIPMDPQDKNGRMSWDQTAVLVAVRGSGNYFEERKGKIICHPDGSNGWDIIGTRDSYLVMKMQPDKLEKIINSLMMHQPKNNRHR